jgi:hypothetical protein
MTTTAKTDLPRGYRNNNPGNIRHSSTSFLGEIPRQEATDTDFKQFKNRVYGYRAMFVILNTYYRKYRLNTIREWISRWAPSADGNHTLAYIDTVCTRTRIPADTPVNIGNEEQMTALVAAMAFVENGKEADPVEIKIAYKFLNP